MRKVILSICIMLAVIGFTGCGNVTPANPSGGGNVVVTNPTDKSSLALINYMPKDRNYMVSPFSLKMAMMLAVNGAEGETESEILKTFGIENIDTYNEYAKGIIEKYNTNKYVKLNVANSIWLNTDEAEGIKFNSTYKDKISKFYSGVASEVNKLNAVKTINDWIANKTNDKIKDALNNAEFLAALVNTIYFKGEWQNQFEEDMTQKDVFTDRNGKETQTDFMKQTEDFRYFEDKNMQMLRLEYKDNDTAMYIVLPKDGGELSNIESSISEMSIEEVVVKIPKFKTEFDLKFNEILQQLGIIKAFDKWEAEFKDKMFSNVPQDVNVYIDEVIQKTFIEVDENGTEAAAATAVLMAGTTSVPMPKEQKIFTADKPFIYFIRDDVTGEILFLGEYAFAE